jgi:hypothetical protein
VSLLTSLPGSGGEGKLERFGRFFDQLQEMRQIELFTEQIIPAFQ